MDAVRRLETICDRKGVALPMAALAYSLMQSEIDVTVIGADSPTQLADCVKSFQAPLAVSDFEEMVAAVGRNCPVSSPYHGKLTSNWG